MCKTNEVAAATQNTSLANPFASAQAFETAQRIGKMFATSPMVPQSYQGNIGSCVIALDIANRIGASPLMVMQNLYIVHGTPSWSSKFLIGCFNSCGRFSPISYETNVNTETDPKKWYCIAKSTVLATGEQIASDKITWQMVEAEGWNKKTGSKWATMPGQMFRYRAAAFLIRTSAPEISFGFYTQEEQEDIVIETPAEVVETKTEEENAVIESLKNQMKNGEETIQEEGK